jgi:hypothetical protein
MYQSKTFDELALFIEQNYTPTQLIDALSLDVSDLIVSLEDHIIDNREVFELTMLGMFD